MCQFLFELCFRIQMVLVFVERTNFSYGVRLTLFTNGKTDDLLQKRIFLVSHCENCRFLGKAEGGITWIGFNHKYIDFPSESITVIGKRHVCSKCKASLYMVYHENYMYIDERIITNRTFHHPDDVLQKK